MLPSLSVITAILLSTLAAQTASLDLLRTAVDPSPTLHSYTASAALVAEAHAVISLQRRFAGTVYYLKPKRTIVFDNLPPPLRRFRELITTTPTYDEAAAEYAITPLADDGKRSSYLLVPKKTGTRVASLRVIVDDREGLISRATWSYINGSRLTFDQAYEAVGPFRIATTIAVSARFPDYRLAGTIRLSDIRTNVPVPAALFEAGP